MNNKFSWDRGLVGVVVRATPIIIKGNK